MATAVGWDSDRLVIWQISRSPRANVASTTAGRRLLDRRSVNGNGTTTTSPPTKSATPHPLQEYPNPPPRLTPRAAAKHARPRFHHCRRRVPADAAEKRAPPAAHSPGRARVPRSRIWLWVTCDKGSVGQRHFGKRRPSGADHEEHPPELIALDATRSWRCRRASYPRSRPGFSRRRRLVLKPLFLRAVRTVAWNAVRGCGCRCRAARQATIERRCGRRGPARALPSRSAGHGRERRAEARAVRPDA
jgi:hypothetical protein